MKGKSEGFTRDSKNFLSARVSAEEMHAALGSPGECDHCGHRVDVGTLIGVLNSWLCDGCHGEWFKGAKWYAQDAPVEDSRVTSLASRFGWPHQRNEAQQQSTSQRGEKITREQLAVNAEPDWKHHEIEITGHGDECVTSELICNAPLGSFCHAKFDCDCEEHYGFGLTDAGVPFHYTWAGERHEGALDKDFCNFRRHYEFHSNLFTGSIRVPVEMMWEDVGYSFKLEPEEMVAGHAPLNVLRDAFDAIDLALGTLSEASVVTSLIDHGYESDADAVEEVCEALEAVWLSLSKEVTVVQ